MRPYGQRAVDAASALGRGTPAESGTRNAERTRRPGLGADGTIRAAPFHPPPQGSRRAGGR